MSVTMKRFVFPAVLLFVLAITVGLGGCGQNNAESAPAAGSTETPAVTVSVMTLQPE